MFAKNHVHNPFHLVIIDQNLILAFFNNSPTCQDAERKNKKNYKWRRPSNESVDISVDIKLPPKGYWTVPKSSPTHLDEVSALRAHQTKKRVKIKIKIKYLNNFILVCKLTGGGAD